MGKGRLSGRRRKSQPREGFRQEGAGRPQALPGVFIARWSAVSGCVGAHGVQVGVRAGALGRKKVESSARASGLPVVHPHCAPGAGEQVQ